MTGFLEHYHHLRAAASQQRNAMIYDLAANGLARTRDQCAASDEVEVGLRRWLD